MNKSTKTNGFKAEGLQELIAIFDKAAENIFGDCSVEHFYYGDNVDMVDIILPDKHYAHFTITKKRVSFHGHTCTWEEYDKFTQLTFNDELYTANGRLLEIAAGH